MLGVHTIGPKNHQTETSDIEQPCRINQQEKLQKINHRFWPLPSQWVITSIHLDSNHDLLQTQNPSDANSQLISKKPHTNDTTLKNLSRRLNKLNLNIKSITIFSIVQTHEDRKLPYLYHIQHQPQTRKQSKTEKLSKLAF